MPLRDKIKRKKYAKQYREEHKEQIAARRADYYRRNSVAIKWRSAEWFEQNREYCLLRAREYNRTHKKQLKATQQRRIAADPEKHRRRVRNRELRVRYGITLADYERIYKKQKGNCALCGSAMTQGRKRASDDSVVDHCHESGVVRGLLHRRCNSLLGYAREDVKILRAAIRYLTTTKQRK